MMRVCVVVLNYRRAQLTIDCLRSIAPEMAGHADRCAVVIDNGSGDDSATEIARAIEENDWGNWLELIASPVNGGFAAGNNIGFQAREAETYILLNSDARLMPGSIDALLESADKHPAAGLIGPRLQGPEGEAQCSMFRYRTPISEMLSAAGTGLLDRIFSRFVVAAGIPERPTESEWVSFACILIRRQVIEQIGLMDEKYFMYFEDIDYSRKAQKAGWRVLHDPGASVIHLRGGSSSVKSSLKSRNRVPKYYYESRSRYFGKFYGGPLGVLFANSCWLIGRTIAFIRELLRTKSRHVCQREFLDNWTNWLAPLRPPRLPKGGEL